MAGCEGERGLFLAPSCSKKSKHQTGSRKYQRQCGVAAPAVSDWGRQNRVGKFKVSARLPLRGMAGGSSPAMQALSLGWRTGAEV